jgi:hypothetical protein
MKGDGMKGWQYCAKHGRNFRTACGKCTIDELRAERDAVAEAAARQNIAAVKVMAERDRLAAQNDYLTTLASDAAIARDTAEEQQRALAARVEELSEIARELAESIPEWVPDDSVVCGEKLSCPSCKRTKLFGHVDCPRQKALGAEEKRP